MAASTSYTAADRPVVPLQSWSERPLLRNNHQPIQFGTNWSGLSRMSGPIQGPLLVYETFSAFALEASFFGILLFGRSRVPPCFYLFSTAMVALGTTLSAYWIMANNSWMHNISLSC